MTSPRHPYVRAVAASGVLAQIANAGGDPTGVLRATGIEAHDLERPTQQISLAGYCDLFERAAAATSEARFGLRFGYEREAAVFGELGLLALSASTIGALLQTLCRYFPALQEQSAVTLGRDGRRAMLTYTIRDGRIMQRRQDAELSIAAFAGMLRRAAGPGFVPDEVLFEHRSPGDDAEAASLMRAPVRHGDAVNALVFPASLLRLPVTQADPARFAVLEPVVAGRARAAAADDLVGLVRDEIRLGLPRGEATFEHVAHRLGISPATLYRRLGAYGLDYSDLLRGQRQATALALLSETSMRLGEIAEALGYSELSAFSRAFRQWTGVSAAAYRRCRAATPLGILGPQS